MINRRPNKSNWHHVPGISYCIFFRPRNSDISFLTPHPSVFLNSLIKIFSSWLSILFQHFYCSDEARKDVTVVINVFFEIFYLLLHYVRWSYQLMSLLLYISSHNAILTSSNLELVNIALCDEMYNKRDISSAAFIIYSILRWYQEKTVKYRIHGGESSLSFNYDNSSKSPTPLFSTNNF